MQITRRHAAPDMNAWHGVRASGSIREILPKQIEHQTLVAVVLSVSRERGPHDHSVVFSAVFSRGFSHDPPSRRSAGARAAARRGGVEGGVIRILHGDCREVLATLPSGIVQCCVTSPPYYGLRDYGVAGQIGLEASPDAFVAEMVAVFREVRRVLRDDGVLWLNLGDSYCSTAPGTMGDALHQRGILAGVSDRRAEGSRKYRPSTPQGMKPKDLLGIPWQVAFALRADGWYLRSDVIWAKPNPMPESVTDRPTSAYEHVFLLTKSARYFFDADAVREESITDDPRRPYGSEGAWQMDGRPSEQRHGGELRAPANVKRGGFNGKTNAL